MAEAEMSPALSHYLKELEQIPPLKRQERKKIFADLSTPKAPQAKERLFLTYLRIVPPIAATMTDDLPIMDTIQEGNQALYQAVEKFDPERGQNFQAYAGQKIFWRLQRSIKQAHQKSTAIEIPTNINNKVEVLACLEKSLGKELGRPPSPKKIARGLGFDPNNYRQMEKVYCLLGEARRIKAIRHPKSWEGLPNPIPKEFSLDKLADEDKEVISSQLAGIFELIFHNLSERDVEVIKLRFGLKDGQCWTFEEISRKFGLKTRESIRQIEAKALRHLRHPKNSRQLRIFL